MCPTYLLFLILERILSKNKTRQFLLSLKKKETKDERVNHQTQRKTPLFYRCTSLALLLSLAFGSPPPSVYAAVKNTKSSSVIIGRGNLLRLTCTEDPKLNGDFRVNTAGMINLPYNVSLHAAGLKVSVFRTLLEETYKPYFHGRPEIQVYLKQKRYWVKVLGVVKNPGDYLVDERTTLGEALAMGAVRTEDLHAGFARITQNGRSRWISMEDYLKGGPDPDWKPWTGGEHIHFQLERPEDEAKKRDGSGEEFLGPSARKVQVIGEVRNPGGVSFRSKGDGYYYLIQRGGPTQYSDLSNVELLRSDYETGEKKLILSGSIREIKDVKESDILLINPTRPTAFEHVLQNSALIATIISSLVLTIYVAKK